MKITFINETYHPDVAATSQYLYDLTTHLAKQGHEITVICSRYNYINSKEVHQKNQKHEGICIYRVKPLKLKNSHGIRRVINSMLTNMALALKLSTLKKQDRVVTLTSPPLVSWFCLPICKIKGSVLVNWCMDLNPDQAIEVGWIKKTSPSAKILTFFAALFHKWTDKTIVLDKFMKERLLSKGVNEAKINICPLWAHDDFRLVDKAKRDCLIREHNLENKFIVMYSGNHSICHPLYTALKAAKKLETYPDIKFVFIGGGPRQAEVEQFKDKHLLDNIAVLPYQKREDVGNALSLADVHLVFMGNEFSGIVHPSKIYTILKLNSPFIYVGPDNSFIGEIVESSAKGVAINNGDVSGFVDQVLKFRQTADSTAHLAATNFEFNQEEVVEHLSQQIIQ